jgi:spore maturation protein CgeB
VPREYDVTFVGARYADRPDHIKDLLDAGIDVHAWGPGWIDPAGVRQLEKPSDLARLAVNPRAWRRLAARGYRRARGSTLAQPVLPSSAVGAPLSDGEMIKMYSRSNISLGFSSVDLPRDAGERICQIRLRDFEAPMSGAFYLVEYQPDLEEFFEIGKEIACYQGREDMVDRCRYYLAHPDEREAIRAAGRERAARDHTWQRRFGTLFESLGLA